MMQRVIARIALALAALAIAGFLAAELHYENRLDAGQKAAFAAGLHAVPRAQRPAVLADLRAGERLHPGTEALLGEALVKLRAGQPAAAEPLARRAVDREPRNWEAWRGLAATLAGRDDAAASRAIGRLRELNPRAP
jgi:Tetratricopeptide repeat